MLQRGTDADQALVLQRHVALHYHRMAHRHALADAHLHIALGCAEVAARGAHQHAVLQVAALAHTDAAAIPCVVERLDTAQGDDIGLLLYSSKGPTNLLHA